MIRVDFAVWIKYSEVFLMWLLQKFRLLNMTEYTLLKKTSITCNGRLIQKFLRVYFENDCNRCCYSWNYPKLYWKLRQNGIYCTPLWGSVEVCFYILKTHFVQALHEMQNAAETWRQNPPPAKQIGCLPYFHEFWPE